MTPWQMRTTPRRILPPRSHQTSVQQARATGRHARFSWPRVNSELTLHERTQYVLCNPLPQTLCARATHPPIRAVFGCDRYVTRVT